MNESSDFLSKSDDFKPILCNESIPFAIFILQGTKNLVDSNHWASSQNRVQEIRAILA